jgi:hypothetical protein
MKNPGKQLEGPRAIPRPRSHTDRIPKAWRTPAATSWAWIGSVERLWLQRYSHRSSSRWRRRVCGGGFSSLARGDREEGRTTMVPELLSLRHRSRRNAIWPGFQPRRRFRVMVTGEKNVPTRGPTSQWASIARGQRREHQTTRSRKPGKGKGRRARWKSLYVGPRTQRLKLRMRARVSG